MAKDNGTVFLMSIRRDIEGKKPIGTTFYVDGVRVSKKLYYSLCKDRVAARTEVQSTEKRLKVWFYL